MKLLLALLVLMCTLAQAQVPNKDGVVTPRESPGKPGESRSGVRLIPGISISISPAALLRAARGPERESIEPGQLLVMWDDDDSAREGLAWLQAQHALSPAETRVLVELGATLALFIFPDAATALRQRDTLRRAQPQWTIDLNARAYPMQRSSAPSTAPARLYALQMLGHNPAAPSAMPRVGVLDAPLDAALLAPDATRWWNGSQLELRSMLGSGDTPGATAHGNAVALLMMGAPLDNGYAGAGPALQMHWAVVMRKTGDDISTNSWLLAQGLDWLVSRKVQLVNMSLGGAGDQILQKVVQRVLSRQVAVLAAAGNQPDAGAVYPAAYAGVWAVTAVDAAGQLYERASRGAFVALAAPGVDVWVPDAASLMGTPSVLAGRYHSGTSYATALASATLARLPAAFWQLDADTRKARLCTLTLATSQPHQGCGRLRLDEAALAALSR
jgi:minor extracellular protease Epr